MLADIVAKGGNLLLNVGPRGRGRSIPDEQAGLLDHLGRWTSGPGATVHASRPWVRPAATLADGTELRFWAADRTVWAAADATVDGPVLVPGVASTPTTSVSLVGGPSLDWEATGHGVLVQVPGPVDHPVLQFDHVDASPI